MAIPVGINGFGRIGRLTARILLRDREQYELRGVNDLAGAGLLAQLFARDSTYGPYGEEVGVEDGALRVGEWRIPVTMERDPAAIPWKDWGAEIVLESTGALRRREDMEAHLRAGARKVLLSAPGKGDRPLDATVVMGVNQGIVKSEHRLVSNASCTTNCLVPMLKVLHERFGIEEALATTVHAYTPTQHLLDGVAKDPRRARSATQNIIPTTTGAAKAAIQVLPELEGRLRALAMRVPVPTGSIVDLSVRVASRASRDAVNEAMREAAAGELAGLLAYTERPMVSSDVVGDSHSCVIDGALTESLNDHTLKVLGWYDNEWGYAARCADTIGLLARVQ